VCLYAILVNIYAVVIYKMIESCTKRRMILAITFLGGQVN
jgi:hypothetical protein